MVFMTRLLLTVSTNHQSFRLFSNCINLALHVSLHCLYLNQDAKEGSFFYLCASECWNMVKKFLLLSKWILSVCFYKCECTKGNEKYFSFSSWLWPLGGLFSVLVAKITKNYICVNDSWNKSLQPRIFRVLFREGVSKCCLKVHFLEKTSFCNFSDRRIFGCKLLAL